MKPDRIREELVSVGRKIIERNLVVGAGGNISARFQNLIYVKPSGYAFDELNPEDYIGVDINTGKVIDGDKRPSCEIHMHLACYRIRPDIQAVVHTHPPLATGVINGGGRIEPASPDFVAFVGRVPLIDFILPGGEELAKRVAEVIKNHQAVLMINHGCVTVGNNLREAFYRTLLIEETARSLLASLIVGKHPRVLSEEEIQGIENLEAETYRKKLLQKTGRQRD